MKAWLRTTRIATTHLQLAEDVERYIGLISDLQARLAQRALLKGLRPTSSSYEGEQETTETIPPNAAWPTPARFRVTPELPFVGVRNVRECVLPYVRC